MDGDSVDATNLEAYWRLYPVEATHAGVRAYDGLLPDLSHDGLEARRAWRRRTGAQLNDKRTDPGEELDRRVLLTELSAEDVFDAWQLTSRSPSPGRHPRVRRLPRA